jgi:hypothetical protein
MAGYNDLVFVYDKEGREYACPIEALKGNVKKKEDLTEEEKKKCLDLNEVVSGAYERG